MPFNREKIVNVSDFLNQLHEKLKAGGDPAPLGFFEIFLKDQLVGDLKEMVGMPDWDGRANAGGFDSIYPHAVEILHEAAGRNYSEVHPDIYKEAHAVSAAFCELLNEVFECSGDDGVFNLIPIRSFVEMAVEAGVAVVKPKS